jgi:hypothetical protein
MRLPVSTVLLLLVGGAAYGQGTATSRGAASPPTEAVATAEQEVPQQNAEDPEWRWRFLSVGADVGVTSAYVWRGFVLHDSACLQPDLWVKLADLTVTSWVNVRSGVAADNHVNEHDLTVDYSRDVRRLTLSAGWMNYRFFGNESGQSNEFYAGVRADVFLQPGVQVYRDVGQGDGTYVSLSATEEWPIGTRATGAAQVAVGYNNHQYIDVSGFSDIGMTLKLTLPIPSTRMALQPAVTYSRSLMPELFPSRLFGALSVAFK